MSSENFPQAGIEPARENMRDDALRRISTC